METDVIILGATFAAVGIAAVLGDRCLVLDRRPQAGYEFINSLNFGGAYDTPLKSDQAEQLFEEFKQKKIFLENRISLFDSAPILYSLSRNKNVLLNTEIISVDESNRGFEITTHGVSGYQTHKAKKVIDTRTLPDMVTKKYLNFLVNTDRDAKLPSSLNTENYGYDGDTVIKCELSLTDGYKNARDKVFDLAKTLEGFKVVMVADEFDYQFKEEIAEKSNGTILLPSQKFNNPLLAFDAGVNLGGELYDYLGNL